MQEKNIELIEQLKNAGLQFVSAQKEISSQKLQGKIIVISGVFEQYSRDELKQMVEDNGGKNSGSISSKTSFVLAGANMGPSKLAKANDLGIEIVDETQFLKMLND